MLTEHRLIGYGAPKGSYAAEFAAAGGGDNKLVATGKQIKADVDSHIEPRFDLVSDLGAAGVGAGELMKKVLLDGPSILYHTFLTRNRFAVESADFDGATTGQLLKDTGTSIGDVKPVSTAVNAFSTVTDGPIEDIARPLTGMFRHRVRQLAES